jgi:hypothetical protein
MLKEASFHLFKGQFFFSFIFYSVSLPPFSLSYSSFVVFSYVIELPKIRETNFLCNMSTTFTNLIFRLLSASSAPFYFFPPSYRRRLPQPHLCTSSWSEYSAGRNKFKTSVHFTPQTQEYKIVDPVYLIRFELNSLIMKRQLQHRRAATSGKDKPRYASKNNI